MSLPSSASNSSCSSLAPLSDVIETIWFKFISYLIRVFIISVAKLRYEVVPVPFNSIIPEMRNWICALIPNTFLDKCVALSIFKDNKRCLNSIFMSFRMLSEATFNTILQLLLLRQIFFSNLH